MHSSSIFINVFRDCVLKSILGVLNLRTFVICGEEDIFSSTRPVLSLYCVICSTFQVLQLLAKLCHPSCFQR